MTIDKFYYFDTLFTLFIIFLTILLYNFIFLKEIVKYFIDKITINVTLNFEKNKEIGQFISKKYDV